MYKHKIEVETECTIGDNVIVTSTLGILSGHNPGVGKVLDVRQGISAYGQVCYLIEYDNDERRLVPVSMVSKATETIDNPYQK